MGGARYPAARRLERQPQPAVKAELQRFADETGLDVSVCHFPPGTSKWNKIEHRMFSRITENWRGRPLASREAVVSLIAATTTRKGLAIRSELDDGEYPTGLKGQRRGDGRAVAHEGRVPRRLELHAFADRENVVVNITTVPRKSSIGLVTC